MVAARAVEAAAAGQLPDSVLADAAIALHELSLYMPPELLTVAADRVAATDCVLTATQLGQLTWLLMVRGQLTADHVDPLAAKLEALHDEDVVDGLTWLYQAHVAAHVLYGEGLLRGRTHLMAQAAWREKCDNELADSKFT